MRSRSGTIRVIRAEHRWDKLIPISAIVYIPERTGRGQPPPRPAATPRKREGRPKLLRS